MNSKLIFSLISLSVVLPAIIYFSNSNNSDASRQVISFANAQTSNVPHWPMAGRDPQRTSYEPASLGGYANKLAWTKAITPYVSSKMPLITYPSSGSRPDLVLVPTASGLIALNADTSDQYWFYQTSKPVGHSPTVVDEVVYLPVHDNRVHAIDINSGNPIWQTDRAGAGFDTNPLVVNGTMYAGSRDGYMYAFNASDGSYKWGFPTGSPISYSPAMSIDNSTIYFASNDAHVYALNVIEGEKKEGDIVWKSAKLPGDGFYTFWPVVAGDSLLIAGTNNYVSLEQVNKYDAFGPNPTIGDLPGSIDSEGWITATKFETYLQQHPQRRTFFELDISSGQEKAAPPILWLGSHGGNRYPAIYNKDNDLAYIHAPFLYDTDFLMTGVLAWEPGTIRLNPIGSNTGIDSNDEIGAISLIGSTAYYIHKEDQFGMYWDIYNSTINRRLFMLSNHLTDATNHFSTNNYPYLANWDKFRYGGISRNGYGTHGTVNPAVPLRNKIFFHMSNTIFAYEI